MDPIWKSLNRDMIQEVMSQIYGMSDKELNDWSLVNKIYGKVAREELARRYSYFVYFQKLVDENYGYGVLDLENKNIRKIYFSIIIPNI